MLNEPGTIALILLALPSVLIAGLTGRRWLRDRRRGRPGAPRWALVGTACWAVLAIATFALPIPWPLPGLFGDAGDGLSWALALETLLASTLVGAWLLDDAARRHRHLHLLESTTGRRARETEHSFAALVEAIPEAVIVVSTSSLEILATNDFARRWLGREEETRGPVPFARWLAPESAGDPQALLAEICEHSATRPQPLHLLRADGSQIEAEVVAASLLFRDRPAVALVARDVSATAQALRAAQALSRAKDRLLTHVSHEVRTPLSGIFGTCESLLDDDLPPALEESLETIQRCAGDLLLTVDDVLDFSRLEAGQLELIPTVFEPAAVVDEVCQHLAPRARAKGLLLIDIPRRDLPVAVRADAGRLRQILVNVVGNAIRFSQRGEIVVLAEPLGQPFEERRRLRLTVSDQGPGIPPGMEERIFQTHPTTEDAATGSGGLGLALCRQLCRVMGGEIRVDSSPGQGATFIIEIPVLLAPVADPPVAQHLAGRSAMVLHPSAAVRRCLREKLLLLGLRSRQAASVEAAAEHLAQAARRGEPCEVLLADAVQSADTRIRDLDADPAPAVVELGVAGLSFPLSISHLREALDRLWAPVPDDAPSQACGQARILVVEDNPVNARLVVNLLRKAGHLVEQAEDGQQALDLLDEQPFDLVLMDVQMPVLDGLEATRRIRRHPKLQDLPVIALTAHALAGDRDLCLEAGMNDYLSKPIHRKHLLETVGRCLRRRRTPTLS